MTLADTSVWIDHLRRPDQRLAGLLEANEVLGHPFVIGELALGGLRRPRAILEALEDLPRAQVATSSEVLHFVAAEKLHGAGIEYVDAHLLASTRLTPHAVLWTHDRRLHAEAVRLGLAAVSH